MANESVGYYNNGVEALRAAIVDALKAPPYTAQSQRIVTMVDALARDALLPRTATSIAAPPVSPTDSTGDPSAGQPQTVSTPAERDRHLVGMPK